MEKPETFQERLEFNRMWWTSVQEGEPISQDEIEEVLWMLEEIRRLTK